MASEQGRTFGELLKHYRVAAGLSQEALAERAQKGDPECVAGTGYWRPSRLC
jgi:hypothetical protein